MGDEGGHAESIVQIKERRFELDAVKFFAIFFMVMIHVYEYLGPYDTDHVMPDSAFRNIIEFLGGPLVAPVLMFCMGIVNKNASASANTSTDEEALRSWFTYEALLLKLVINRTLNIIIVIGNHRLYSLAGISVYHDRFDEKVALIHICHVHDRLPAAGCRYLGRELEHRIRCPAGGGQCPAAGRVLGGISAYLMAGLSYIWNGVWRVPEEDS